MTFSLIDLYIFLDLYMSCVIFWWVKGPRIRNHGIMLRYTVWEISVTTNNLSPLSSPFREITSYRLKFIDSIIRFPRYDSLCFLGWLFGRWLFSIISILALSSAFSILFHPLVVKCIWWWSESWKNVKSTTHSRLANHRHRQARGLCMSNKQGWLGKLVTKTGGETSIYLHCLDWNRYACIDGWGGCCTTVDTVKWKWKGNPFGVRGKMVIANGKWLCDAYFMLH